MSESKQTKGLAWQTYESRLTDSQGFFDRVANPPVASGAQNKTAAPVDAGSGGDELEKLHSVSGGEFYASLRIITTHFGLGDDDRAASR